MNADDFRELAISFPATLEQQHFERRAFKVMNKRIFATLHEESETANLKLSPEDQSVYSTINQKAIYPVNNKWGLQGWTTFVLKDVDSQLMLDALDAAHKEIFKTKPKHKRK